MRSRLVLVALIVGACGCGGYKALDPSQVDKLEMRGAPGAISACGLEPVALPPIDIVMKDGSHRGVGSGDTAVDPKEISWTASVGTVALAKEGFVWSPPPDSSALVENDVKLVATMSRKAEAKTERSITPTFACKLVADFGGAPGGEGEFGRPGDGGSDASPGGAGKTGGPAADGAQGGDASPVEVAITQLDTKRGPLAFATITRPSDGARASYLFSPKGGSLLVINAGGAGGLGGHGGDGGGGGNGLDRSQAKGPGACTAPGVGGSGGKGGNGGKGGKGGQVTVRVDDAHPELERVVQVDVSAGPGGNTGTGGNGGGGGISVGVYDSGPGSNASCSDIHPQAESGQAGPDGDRQGQPGSAGSSSVAKAPAAQLFPGGVSLGALASNKPPVKAAAPAAAAPAPVAAAKGNAPAGKKGAPAAASAAPKASAAPVPASWSVTNGSKVDVCTVDTASDKGGTITFASTNLISGKKLTPGQTATLVIPSDAKMLRVVSCDKKQAGMTGVVASSPMTLTINTKGAGPTKQGGIALGPASDYAGSPFAIK